MSWALKASLLSQALTTLKSKRKIHNLQSNHPLLTRRRTTPIKCKKISLHKTIKINLPIFSIDLEPSVLSKDVFHVNQILYTKLKIEEQNKRRDLVQCHNCQDYGHTKTYCAHTPRCVRCASPHFNLSKLVHLWFRKLRLVKRYTNTQNTISYAKLIFTDYFLLWSTVTFLMTDI